MEDFPQNKNHRLLLFPKTARPPSRFPEAVFQTALPYSGLSRACCRRLSQAAAPAIFCPGSACARETSSQDGHLLLRIKSMLSLPFCLYYTTKYISCHVKKFHYKSRRVMKYAPAFSNECPALAEHQSLPRRTFHSSCAV